MTDAPRPLPFKLPRWLLTVGLDAAFVFLALAVVVAKIMGLTGVIVEGTNLVR